MLKKLIRAALQQRMIMLVLAFALVAFGLR
jgi:Cu/Ag efflux pump CusA